MIALKSSENHDWPWSNSGDIAESVFERTFPSLYAHLRSFEAKLRARNDQGRYWWELRSCAYWSSFDTPKLMYPELTWRLEWSLDVTGTLCNNTAYMIPTDDTWVLAVANSPVT